MVLAIALFYLYDAALALQPEQGLLRRGRKQWLARLATEGFELRRQRLLWPPLWLLHQPLYRLHWNPTRIVLPGEPAPALALATHAASFKGFALPLYLLAAALFIALPIALFALHSEAILLAMLALIYLCTLCIALLTLRHGRRGHSERRLARSTALQLMLCPPFALNAVRKLSLAHGVDGDLLQSAQQLMAPAQWSVFAGRVQAVMEQELQEIAELPEYAQHHAHMQTALETLKTGLAGK
ncbi:hypothetical protein [Comamonas sp. GB3 AK4-5]|uniref:hypothetical protein n=1 Tax=Comamonas sp. GB3 AK4-5 TaxID=3231487 RepID=UPI00351F3937